MESSPGQPYAGFQGLHVAAQKLGPRYAENSYLLLTSKILGYRLGRVKTFLYSRFTLDIDPDLKKSIVEWGKGTGLYRVELVFLLFQVSIHILSRALPSGQSIKHKQFYQRLLDMTRMVTCDSDLEDLLVQFVSAFPTDVSIDKHRSVICDYWVNDHHPVVFLEMISLIASLEIATRPSQPYPPLESRDLHCTSILSKLESFHKRSGEKLTVCFTKAHLSRRQRVKNHPDAPLFFYQCLLGRIAQIWLTRNPKGRGVSGCKRNVSGVPVDCLELQMDRFHTLFPVVFPFFSGMVEEFFAKSNVFLWPSNSRKFFCIRGPGFLTVGLFLSSLEFEL